MKFKPNDPVWVMSKGAKAFDDIPAGEHPGVVVEECLVYRNIYGYPGYIVVLCTSLDKIGVAEHRLRPRRDDYQQHEPLGSRTSLNLFIDKLEAKAKELEHSK